MAGGDCGCCDCLASPAEYSSKPDVIRGMLCLVHTLAADLELLGTQLNGDDGGSQPPAKNFSGQRRHAAQQLQRQRFVHVRTAVTSSSQLPTRCP